MENVDWSVYKQCGGCSLIYPKTNYFKNKARYDGVSGHCKKCHTIIASQSTIKLRQEAIALYGNKCIKCGYNADFRAFQFDHVNSDGHLSRMSPSVLLRDIILDKTGRYQLLCANCNMIKMYEAQERNKGYDFAPPLDVIAKDKENLRGVAKQNKKPQASIE